MVAQAFKDCDRKHYAAIGIAMIPSVADYLYTQVTGAAGLADLWTEVLPSGINDFVPEVSQALIDAGVMWNGVAATKAGAILIGIILGTLTVFIIDHKLDRAAITALVGYVLAALGFIHSAALGFYPLSPYALGYLIVAVLAYLCHLGTKKWLQAQDDFEYV